MEIMMSINETMQSDEVILLQYNILIFEMFTVTYSFIYLYKSSLHTILVFYFKPAQVFWLYQCETSVKVYKHLFASVVSVCFGFITDTPECNNPEYSFARVPLQFTKYCDLISFPRQVFTLTNVDLNCRR